MFHLGNQLSRNKDFGVVIRYLQLLDVDEPVNFTPWLDQISTLLVWTDDEGYIGSGAALQFSRNWSKSFPPIRIESPIPKTRQLRDLYSEYTG